MYFISLDLGSARLDRRVYFISARYYKLPQMVSSFSVSIFLLLCTDIALRLFSSARGALSLDPRSCLGQAVAQCFSKHKDDLTLPALPKLRDYSS
jgi:hypothetical protein